jgi:hypothetical protein
MTVDEALSDLHESVRKIDAIMAEHPVRAAHAAMEVALRAAALAMAVSGLNESSKRHLLNGALLLLTMAVRELGLEAIWDLVLVERKK